MSLLSLSFIFIIGLVMGSFVNVLIMRVPVRKSVGGRSQCMYCHAPIAAQYPLVELAVAVFSVVGVSIVGGTLLTQGALLALLPLLVALFVIDLKHGIVPDVLSLPAIVLALLMTLSRTSITGATVYTIIIATLCGASFFLLQWSLSRGRWVGSGDIRLGAILGALSGGIPQLALMLFLAYVIGAFVAVALLISGKVTRKTHIPFGPFLLGAAIVVLFWGTGILAWYMKVIGL
jgi:prepilin signal peptidase PulO-like enzyme (type II secretory pathway)